MAELKIGRMVLGVCQTNCYFLYREGSNRVIFIDPADSGKYINQVMKEKGFLVEAILLTHGHFDHIWGCSELRALTGAKVYALDLEEEVLSSARLNVSESSGRSCTVKPNFLLKDEQEIEILDMKFRVLSTPGHTKGSCCYYFYEDQILISGDTLFEGSVGRTDLPTGSMGELSRSIKNKLSNLPGDVRVYPGHGGITTIADEKKNNPYWVD